MLSRLVVNIYAALLEIGLWLLLGVGLFAGWEAKGAIGAAVGLVLAAVFGAVFFGAFLVLNDIRSRVKAIEAGKHKEAVSSHAAADLADKTTRPSGGGANASLAEAKRHFENPLTAEKYAAKYGITLAQVEGFVANRLLLGQTIDGQLYVPDRRLPEHLLKSNS